MKLRIKKWFTLIELMVVIVIIGILIATWMRLNWWSLEKLRAKSASEEVSSFFDTTFLQIQASNYQQGKAYTGIDLVLKVGSNNVPYVYHLSNKNLEEGEDAWSFSWEFWGDYTIMQITWDTNWTLSALSSVTVKYLPFKPTCEFYSWNTASDINKLFFSVKPRWLKNACFELDSNYCKLKTITCEEDRIDF